MGSPWLIKAMELLKNREIPGLIVSSEEAFRE